MNPVRSEPLIAVGILSDTVVHFTLHGEYSGVPPASGLQGPCSVRPGAGCIVLTCGPKNYELRGSIELSPVDPARSLFTLEGVTVGERFHWEHKEDHTFAGGLRFISDGKKITAINTVPIEEYLASVISSEMSADASLEFLRAHAMTSRSWLLAQLEKLQAGKAGALRSPARVEDDDERIVWYDREDHADFDVCAGDHCQRYQGLTTARAPFVRRAVETTRGQVLVHGGEICDARFSKSCGGVSELFENVWEPVPHPYLASIVDAPAPPQGFLPDLRRESNAEQWIRGTPPAFCNATDKAILSRVLGKKDRETSDFYRWKVEYTQEEVAALLYRKSGIDFGNILDLRPGERGASARIVRLKIVGSKRTCTIGKELEIRRVLSPSHLYSSAFVVDRVGEDGGIPARFVLTGAGWGHGVGLCQIGAAVMGEMGQPADAILHHYFSGTEIRTLY